jgi:hypothetical protein
MKTQITIKQVKQIALSVSAKYEFVNHGTHYNIIDKKTRQSSNEGGRKNLVYGHFCNLVEYEYLNMIGENGLYFDWQKFGVEISNERKSYVYKIQYKIVELMCGYKY